MQEQQIATFAGDRRGMEKPCGRLLRSRWMMMMMMMMIDNLHISHNASGMGANIRVLLIRNSSSHSSLDVKGLHHYYTLHRLSVQIKVPSWGSISKKKLVCLYKFGMIFFRRMFSTTYLKMR